MNFLNECVNKKCVEKKVVATAIKETFKISNSRVRVDTLDIQSLNIKQFMKFIKRFDSEIVCLYSNRSFNRKLNRYQKKVLTILKEIKSDNHDKFMKKKFEYSIDELKKRILKAYYSEIEIFMRDKANELASYRKENHEINLIFETKSSIIRNYKSLFEKKLKIVKHYVNEYFQKEFIKSSLSKTATSMLLIKKSENELRFCVNYRALNEITVKNRYSIFLINITLAKLSRVK